MRADKIPQHYVLATPDEPAEASSGTTTSSRPRPSKRWSYVLACKNLPCYNRTLWPLNIWGEQVNDK